MVLGQPPSSGGLRHTDMEPLSDLPRAGLGKGRIGTPVNSLVGQSGHSGSSVGGGRQSEKGGIKEDIPGGDSSLSKCSGEGEVTGHLVSRLL